MSAEPPPHHNPSAETLAPASDLLDFGQLVIHQLDKAEALLDDTDNQPFSGITPHVMRDMAHLRNRQFDMFRRHVEIEQTYKVHSDAPDGNDVQRMTFSGIATTMRRKESATANFLNRLEDFDAQLRAVMDRFENTSPSRTSASDPTPSASTSARASVDTSHTPPADPTPTAQRTPATRAPASSTHYPAAVVDRTADDADGAHHSADITRATT